MNFYEKQMHSIFGESAMMSADTVFANRTLLTSIGKDLRAKVDFINTNVADHYNAMKLSIINRTEGVVDSHIFKFSDIIGVKNGYEPYIWDDRGDPDWYMYRPTYKDLRDFEAAVEDYIAMYADPNIVENAGMSYGGM